MFEALNYPDDNTLWMKDATCHYIYEMIFFFHKQAFGPNLQQSTCINHSFIVVM